MHYEPYIASPHLVRTAEPKFNRFSAEIPFVRVNKSAPIFPQKSVVGLLLR